MSDRHLAHWPPGLPRRLTLPQTNLYYNVEVSAARYPDKPYLVFYDSPITFGEFKRETERIAGFLQGCGVKAGDRVLLYLQNSPQWVLGYYGILRANAVVVPVNPMNMTDELAHYVADSGAKVAIVAQDLFGHIAPLLHTGEGEPPEDRLAQIVVATYSDYVRKPTALKLPDFVAAPRQTFTQPGVTAWVDMLVRDLAPGPLTAGPDDLCVMPYTSGTTGQPKGCMHTHRSVMATCVGGVQWFRLSQEAVFLSVLPFFHVTGMTGSMNGPLFLGATVILLPRWDRDAAAQSIERYRVTVWQVISTMMVDFLTDPKVGELDVSSLAVVRGGGAAMPEAIAAKLQQLTGLQYVEGYGMSETMAATHMNPPQRPKKQCLGIPMYEVDSRVVNPETFEELGPGEEGEIVVHAPQVMRGYWRNEAATAEAFVELDGKRFLRTGDLAQVDADGYFFMVDRLKRMINASGFKVWPAEVESMMYKHPAIREVCIISSPDPRRGETVKALIVLRPDAPATTAEDVIAWSHEHMAAYKCPRLVEFVDELPKSGSGKIQWRELQAREAARSRG